MPVRPLNPATLTPATIAMFDRMVDGAWYSNSDLIGAGAAACARHEREEALKNGYRVRRKTLAKGRQIPEADILDSGAKDIARNRLMIAVRSGRVERDGHQHRMLPETVAEWTSLRPHLTANADNVIALTTRTAPDPSEQKAPSRRGRAATQHIFGGLTEAEGFAAAPLVAHDLVHFRVEGRELPLAAFRDSLPAGCVVTVDEGDGLYRVECGYGTGPAIRDHIRDWCEANDVKTRGLRPETNFRRRSARDLDPAFLHALCQHYAATSMSTLRRHMTTLQFHYADPDDLTQQTAEWILKAVAMYDDTQGVPFGAFLNQRLGKWVHDLNRNAYGRSATDAELKQQRATARLTHEFGRTPTEKELADHLGQNLVTFRKNALTVATLNGLRNIQTIDGGADGETDIAIPDSHQAEDEIMDETAQSMLSQLLTAACTPDPSLRGKAAERPNVLGWVAWYSQMWGQMSKTELAAGLNTSMRNMNVYSERAQIRMQERRNDLIG